MNDLDIVKIELAKNVFSWGAKLHIPSVKQTKGLCCEESDCRFSVFSKGFEDQVVGFSTSAPRNSSADSLGAIIFECPVHFKKFWFHLRIDGLINYVENVPSWPSETKEVLRKLLEKHIN